MAPTCRNMAPRSFQEPSWPLLGALGPLLGRSSPLLAALGSLLVRLGLILEPLGTILGRSWGILERSWGILGRSRAPKRNPPSAESLAGGPPLETFCESLLPSRGLEILTILRDVHGSFTTRVPCCAGGGGTRTPRGVRPPPPRRGVPRTGCVRQRC